MGAGELGAASGSRWLGALFSLYHPGSGRSGETEQWCEEEEQGLWEPTELFVPEKAPTRLPQWPWYFCMSSASILSAELAWECFPYFDP